MWMDVKLILQICLIVPHQPKNHWKADVIEPVSDRCALLHQPKNKMKPTKKEIGGK
jgi:hypothetical protein